MWGEVTRQLALWPWLPVLNTGSEGRGGEGEGVGGRWWVRGEVEGRVKFGEV